MVERSRLVAQREVARRAVRERVGVDPLAVIRGAFEPTALIVSRHGELVRKARQCLRSYQSHAGALKTGGGVSGEAKLNWHTSAIHVAHVSAQVGHRRLGEVSCFKEPMGDDDGGLKMLRSHGRICSLQCRCTRVALQQYTRALGRLRSRPCRNQLGRRCPG